MTREEFNFASSDTAAGSSYSGPEWRRQLDGERETVNNSRRPPSQKPPGVGCSALCVGVLVAVVVIIVLLCISLIVVYENEGQVVAKVDLYDVELPAEQTVWFEANLAELRNAFRVVDENKKRAKNVVLFIALDSAAASPGDPRPVWESFPHLALLRPTTSDGAGASVSFNPTAMFCGIEPRHRHTVGFDSAVSPSDDCNEPPNSTHRAASILQWAQAVGRLTGVVTNGELVQPTPAALYAHTPNSSWLYVGPDEQQCPDVRTQLLYGETGRALNVIAGTLPCPEEFCREAFESAWEGERLDADTSYKLATELKELLDPALDEREYALGLFERQTLAQPNAFHDLTVGALHVLDRPEGFVLVAIADPSVSIGAAEVDAAVKATLRKLSTVLDDSLIVVVRSDAREGDAAFATVHATGPMSHLLHRVHDQTFLAHFISYAARIGRFRDADLTNFILQMV